MVADEDAAGVVAVVAVVALDVVALDVAAAAAKSLIQVLLMSHRTFVVHRQMGGTPSLERYTKRAARGAYFGDANCDLLQKRAAGLRHED